MVMIAGGNCYAIFAGKNVVMGIDQNERSCLGFDAIPDRDHFTQISSSLPLSYGEFYTHLATGPHQTLLYTSNDRLLAIGGNRKHALGLEDSNTVQTFKEVPRPSFLAAGETYTHMACGFLFSLICTSKNKLLGTGWNGAGRLGLGDIEQVEKFTEIKLPKAIQLAPGEHFTHLTACFYGAMLCTSNNRLLATGRDSHGVLGLGDLVSTKYFTSVSLPAGFVFSKNETFTHVVTENMSAILVTSANRLLSTGYNLYGQLGLGHYNETNNFTEVDLGSNCHLEATESITHIACSSFHTVFATSDNQLFGTGKNDQYQITFSREERFNAFTQVPCDICFYENEIITGLVCGAQTTMLCTSEGRMFIRGGVEYGQFGMADRQFPLDEFTAIGYFPQYQMSPKIAAHYNNAKPASTYNTNFLETLFKDYSSIFGARAKEVFFGNKVTLAFGLSKIHGELTSPAVKSMNDEMVFNYCQMIAWLKLKAYVGKSSNEHGLHLLGELARLKKELFLKPGAFGGTLVHVTKEVYYLPILKPGYETQCVSLVPRIYLQAPNSPTIDYLRLSDLPAEICKIIAEKLLPSDRLALSAVNQNFAEACSTLLVRPTEFGRGFPYEFLFDSKQFNCIEHARRLVQIIEKITNDGRTYTLLSAIIAGGVSWYYLLELYLYCIHQNAFNCRAVLPDRFLGLAT